MIVANGPDAAEIMLVGDYASKTDVQIGSALNNLSGIKQIFGDNGFNIDQCYKTLYIKNGLSYYGKAKKLFNKAIFDALKEPINYQSILFNEIKEVQPNVIVPLGELALKILADVSGIEKYRGSILPLNPIIQSQLLKPIRVIPTYPPQRLFEDWSCRVIANFDIQRILSYRSRMDPLVEPGNLWICKTVDAFRSFLKRQNNREFVTFDIETVAGFLTCISFCFDGNESICVPLTDRDMDPGNRTLLWAEVNKVLKSSIGKVNQNIKYDWTILERFGFNVQNIIGDTMLAAHLLYPELPKRLDFWTSIYTTQPYYKDEGKGFDPRKHNKSQYYFYNAKDSLVAWQIHKAQQTELEEANLTPFYNNYTIPLMKLYKKIDDHGMLVDVEKREFIIAKYLAFADLKQRTIEIMCGHPVNLNSPAQVQKLIFEELKFPKRHKQSAEGELRLTTDEDSLVDLILFYPLDNIMKEQGAEILQMIVDWRKIMKIVQYSSIPIHPDNRLRTSYKLHGTNSGRSAGGGSLDSLLEWDDGKLVQIKLGGALSTLPKHGFKIGSQYYGRDIREMFIPRPGYVLIEGDLSQAEARAVAVMAEDYELVKAFDVYPGVHKLTASWIYDCKPEDIQKGTNEYHMGKTVRHAGNNNMKEWTLSEQTHISITAARELLEKFHRKSPNIRGIFHKEIRDIVRQTRQLVTPFGRKRDFFSKLDENLYNQAIGYIQQSAISDQIKFAMLRVEARLPWVEFIYEGHDSAMSEVPENKIDEYCSVYTEETQKPINFSRCSLSRDYDLLIPVELEISGTNWNEMRPYKK